MTFLIIIAIVGFLYWLAGKNPTNKPPFNYR